MHQDVNIESDMCSRMVRALAKWTVHVYTGEEADVVTLPEGVTEVDIEIYDQINKDVYRTRREHTECFGKHFADPDCFTLSDIVCIVEPKNGFDAMARILFLYAKLNPGIRYSVGLFQLQLASTWLCCLA